MKECRVLLLLLVWTSAALAYPNVALRGKAAQSSRQAGGFSNAQNAIDGNIAPSFFSGSCSHTKSETTDPWWRVDLLDSYVITSITIFNRQDCCSDRLDGAEIHVGDSLLNDGKNNPIVGHVESPAGVSKTFNFEGTSVMGRYVLILLPGTMRTLHVCEVQVFGYPKPTGDNLAIHGKAAQSSIYNDELAYFAIDGDRKGSCTHTKEDNPAWLRLDLGKKHKIFAVNVTNRVQNPERLNGAEIRIGDSLTNMGNNNPRCAVISNIPGGFTQGFPCNGMDGRYVNIVIPGRAENLHVCQVEVYGSELD